MSRTRMTGLVLSLVVLLAACGGETATGDGGTEPGTETETGQVEGGAGETLQVAVLFPGLVDDESWNQIGFEGLQRAEADLGVEIAHSEQVTPAEAEEAFRDFAARGFGLVIGHGGEFEDSVERVAQEFPDVAFVVTNGGGDNGSNYAAYRAAAQEWKFLAGALAGLTTEADSVSYVAGMCFPAIATWVNGARDGVAHVNPEAEYSSTFTGDFADSAIALETANAVMEGGADVILTTLDEAYRGVIEAAEGTDTKLILEHFDHIEKGTDNVVTSSVLPYGDLVYQAVEDVHNDEFSGELYVATMADLEEPQVFTEINGELVSDDVQAQLEELQAAIISGEIEVAEDTTCP